MNFEDHFKPHIFERGVDYFEQGAVKKTELSEDCLSAVVSGSQDYHVKIFFEDGEIEDVTCDCPYAKDDNYCKHEAAVLVYLEEVTDFFEKQAQRKEQRIEQYIAEMSDEAVRGWLKKLALKDEAIARQILGGPGKGKKIKGLPYYRRELKEIIWRYAGEENFIDYRQNEDFVLEMEKFINTWIPDFLDNNAIEIAFEVLKMITLSLMDMDWEDYDGSIWALMNYTATQWDEVLAQCQDPDLKQRMLYWLENHEAHRMLKDEIHNLLRTHGDDDYQKAQREKLDREIADFEARGIFEEKSEDFERYKDVLLDKAFFLEKNGDRNAQKDFYKRYRKYPTIRNAEVEFALEREDFIYAAKILEEGAIETNKENDGCQRLWLEKVIDIYEYLGDRLARLKALKRRVFDHVNWSMVYIDQLKQASTAEEWQGYKQRLLNTKMTVSLRCEFLFSEAMYPELLSALKNCISPETVEPYLKTLYPLYPKDIEKIYEALLDKAMAGASDRNYYGAIAQKLKGFAALSGNAAFAKALADRWRENYPRRRAMIDELGKRGL
ncbi:MAG: SWIM zinc finger family protein [Eubacterium sp.]|nr:SWIM zinc finger family protein [Eubacterium sp.]